jgi:hypothetical protein
MSCFLECVPFVTVLPFYEETEREREREREEREREREKF